MRLTLLKIAVVFLVLESIIAQAIPIPVPYDGIILGDLNCNVTIEFFYDPLCSDSKNLNENFEEVYEEYGFGESGTYSLIYHSSPLADHYGSFFLTKAIRIIQNEYGYETAYEFLNDIFDNQHDLVQTETETYGSYIDYMTEFTVDNTGIDGTYFMDEFNDEELDTEARTSWKYSTTRGVYATPAIFANGVLIPAASDWTTDDIIKFLKQEGVIEKQLPDSDIEL